MLARRISLMVKMGYLPTSPEVREMTDEQWLVVEKFSVEEERRRNWTMFAFATNLLGTSIEGNKHIPFAMLLNDKVAEFFQPMIPEEITEEIEAKVFSEETTREMDEGAFMDIDSMLTDEDRKKIEQMNLVDMIKHEKLAGLVDGPPVGEHE